MCASLCGHPPAASQAGSAGQRPPLAFFPSRHDWLKLAGAKSLAGQQLTHPTSAPACYAPIQPQAAHASHIRSALLFCTQQHSKRGVSDRNQPWQVRCGPSRQDRPSARSLLPSPANWLPAASLRAGCGPTPALKWRASSSSGRQMRLRVCAAAQQPPAPWRLASAVCSLFKQAPAAAEPQPAPASAPQQVSCPPAPAGGSGRARCMHACMHASGGECAAQHQHLVAAQDDTQSLLQQLRTQSCSAAAVLPFASTTIIKASSSTQAEIYFGLAKAVDVRRAPGGGRGRRRGGGGLTGSSCAGGHACMCACRRMRSRMHMQALTILHGQPAWQAGLMLRAPGTKVAAAAAALPCRSTSPS